MRRYGRNNPCLPLLFLWLVTLCTASTGGGSFGITRQGPFRLQELHSRNNGDLLRLLRGGSTAEVEEEEVEVEDEGNEEDADEEEDEPVSISSMKPVRLLIQTNWGNQVLDQQVELMAARTRNVASLKKSIQRQLPGRPPILSLELVYEGRVLDDEILVDELFDEDDEDDDDEEEEGGPIRTIILNSIPPVDPKFATELSPKLKAHAEDDDETLSTEELIEAYFLNQAAMSRNAQLLGNANLPSSPLLRHEIQEAAKELQENLKSQVPEDVWQSSLEPVRKSHRTEERRGQRYRSGKGGATTSLKKNIQHNMNINWGETIRNSLLFLFFGYFGGRNTLSRSLMLWGAPLCFFLQARPVKMWVTILFYMQSNPPGIFLSLLPAPTQAILTFNAEKSYSAIYSTDEEKARREAALKFQKEEVEEDETEDEWEAEDEDESEGEYESEEDESEDESELEEDESEDEE